MKRSLLLVCCVALATLLYAQTQEEKNESTPINQNTGESDDLAPYPFDEKKPEKKTFREKVRESIYAGKEESPDTVANAEKPEVHIRFYEFKDITFEEDDEMEFESDDSEVGPIDEYDLVEDDSVYEGEGYYKDVTFENEKKIKKKEIKYDDEIYAPYRKRNTERSRSTEKTTTPEKKENQTIKINSTQKPIAKPIEIKGKDFYRKDYIYYYYNRKKKASSDIASYTNYSSAMERCRYLFNEDKRAVQTIYEKQLQEADHDFSEKINSATSEEEKGNLKSALDKTKLIIKRVYEDEERNLKNAFDKAEEGLDKKFNKQRPYIRN